MTLRLQINLIVGALTLLFAVAVMALQLRGMRESVHEEVVAANRVASQLLDRTVWRYAAQGNAALLGFLQGLGRVRSNDISFFDAQGRELYHSPPSPYKAGRDAPGWFAALLAPPPAEQSIRFPDGRIVVRANASRAILDAWEEMAWLGGGALAMLVLANALVFWLVGRTVRPFPRIVAALDTLQQGRFDVALPALPGREAAAIAAAFNHMLGQLQAHLETERRAARAELQLSDTRELQRWLDGQVEAERRMIARELHDEFGQSVTAMRSLALAIAQRSSDAQTIRTAQLVADEALRLYDAMHGIIPRLAPLVLDRFGLAEALADLAERTRRSQPGLAFTTQVDLGLAQLSPESSLALYRAAQEGVTNALRHGQARHLALQVQATEGQVQLQLDDDGSGLPPEGVKRAGHYGLRWLAERVQDLGGVLSVSPVQPHGARLAVRLPLPAGAAA
jgi:two-component system, NarL family, sensor histidine kinase UhpB